MSLDQQQLQTLQTLALQMNENASDPGWALKASVTRFKEVLRLINASFFLLDKDAGDLYLAASALPAAVGVIGQPPISPKNDILQQVFDAQVPVFVIDAAEWNDRVAFRLTSDTLSVALFPMRVKGRLVGMLILESDKGSVTFAEPVQTLITLLLNQIAIILHASRFSQRRSEMVAQKDHSLLLLNRLSATLNASLDAHEILRMTTIHLVEISGADYGSALIVKQGWQEGQVIVEYPSEHFIDHHLPLPDSPSIRRILASGAPYVVENASENLLLSPLSERISRLGFRSMLLAPMLVHRQLIGMLILISQNSPALFSKEMIEICQTIASQAAAAVSNARLLHGIQQQKRALTHKSREIAREYRTLSAIIDHIADGVLVTDLSDCIFLANPAFQALIDSSCQPLVGRPLPELLTDAGLIPSLRQALETPEQTFIARLALPDGRVLKASSTALTLSSPITEPRTDEQIAGVVTIFQDVTRDVKIDRAKADFIDAVSHELCTPLTAILGFANLIQRDFNRWIRPQIDGEEEERIAQRIIDNLSIIESESRRLGRLVSDLDDVSAAEAG